MKFGGTFQLYKITLAMRQLLDRIAITDEDSAGNEALLVKQGDKMDEQIYACMAYALELEAQAKAREDAMQRMADANGRDLKKAAWLRDYVLRAVRFADLPLPRTYTEFSIGLRKNPASCEIVDESLLPADYLRQPEPKPLPPPMPDKKKILADLKEGCIIPGAQIAATTYRLVID